MRRSFSAWLVVSWLYLASSVALAAGVSVTQNNQSVRAASVTHGAKQPSAIEQPASPPREVTDTWWSGIQADLKTSEYHATWTDAPTLPSIDAAYQAPNRAQNLRTYFAPNGAHLVSRNEAAPTWSVNLGIHSIGRGHTTKPVGKARIVTNANRVDYVREELTEWYINDERGLEQGFVIAAPPAGAGDLVLRLGAGDATPKLASEGVVEFFTDDGARVLRYADLKSFAKDGRSLPSTMAVNNGMVELRVAAADADYPVTIDPLATSPNWTAESDQVNAGFGLASASAGDVNGDGFADVIVGAWGFDNGEADEGRIFVYLGSAAGLATTAIATAESNQIGALFGTAVASAGDVNGDGYADVIIGALQRDNVQVNEGAAFVIHGAATGLAGTVAWAVEGQQDEANFGIAVASAGDVNRDGYADVIVSASGYDNGQTDEGRVYVYHGSASGLSTTPAWTMEPDQAGADFGTSVASAGDVNGDGYADVIIGAFFFDNGETNEGRAFVYQGGATGLSTTAAWTSEGNQANAWHGVSVGSAGDVNGDGYADVIVGANKFDNGQTDEGRALVYYGSPSGVSATAAWSAEGDQADARFGNWVTTAGDVNGDGYADVIIGAPQFDNGEADEGKAFVFYGGASGLSLSADWTVESDQVGARLGTSVAAAGDVNGDGYADVITGAPEFDNGQTDEGRAFVYHGGASGLSANAAWTTTSDIGSAQLGSTVASAGDVNGDGYSDVMVAAVFYDNGQTDEGRVFVFHGGATGLASIAAWSAEGNQASAQFGGSIASAGDVNGDEYADVIVGAPAFDGDLANEGKVFVYLGSASGLSTTEAWSPEGDQSNAVFGTSVASAGDVNGDGYSDVMVGASSFDNGQTDEGRVFVYYGGVTGLSTVAAWTAESEQASANFGSSVASAGDVNGDGYADVIIGAHQFDNDQANEGRAFVYHGSASGLAATAAWTAESNQSNSWFGKSVASAGDVNGDGYSDVIVSAYLFDNGETEEGRAFLYHGGASGLAVNSAWSDEGDQANANFGFSVASAGDVNGDGYGDVIVGAPRYSNDQSSEGHAFVYAGSAAGISATVAWTLEGNQVTALLGSSVASAGDVNGDGYADVIAGSPRFNTGQSFAGRASVFYGNSAGRGFAFHQARGGVAAGVAQSWALSQSNNSFRVRVNAISPMGRVAAKLQVQACPSGIAFGNVVCTTSTQATWSDTTATSGGALLTQEVTGLTASTAYHWRARLLYAPFALTVAAVTAPPKPVVGPWRTLSAQAPVADIRIGSPEIEVRGNGAVISDGDLFPGTLDHTNFGSVSVVATLTRTYTIHNIGPVPMSVGNVAVGGAQASDFTVTTQPISPVPANGSTTFQVTFAPSAAGSRNASLSFANNDLFESPFDFGIVGNGVNAAPTISNVSNQTIIEDSNTGALTVTVGDAETAAGSLLLTGSSSNTSLVPNGNIVFGGNGATRTVTVTPTANLSGTATITLTVTDGFGASNNDTFLLTVNAVNDQPVLSLGSVATLPAGSTGVQTVAGFASVDLGPADEDSSQAVADYLIDSISDPDGILTVGSLDIANNGTLSYTLTGVGGAATIMARAQDNGGTANGGVDTSAASPFTISVTPGADLQIDKTNHQSNLLNGEQTLYTIVVANAGPNSVTGANLVDLLPSTLINASWACVSAQSTAPCPVPDTGTGNLNVLVDLGVNQYLRFDLLAEVNGTVGAFVINTATITPPAGTTALNPANDSATDQDPIVPDGLFADSFEGATTSLTVPMADEVLHKH